MADTIGRLNVQVTASAPGVAGVMQQVSNSATQMSASVASASNTIATSAGKSGRAGRVFQEASRGFEDFMAAAATGGAAAGFRGAANNISQLAGMFGPMAGGIAGVSVALGTALLPRLFDTSAQAKLAESAMNKLKQSFADARAELERLGAERSALQDIAGSASVEASRSAGGKVARESELVKGQIDDLNAARKKLEADIAKGRDTDLTIGERFSKFRNSSGFIAGVRDAFAEDPAKKMQDERKKELTDLNRKRRELEEQLRVNERLRKAQTDNEAALQAEENLQKQRDEVAAQIERANKAREEASKLERKLIDQLDEQGAKRRKILDDFREQQKIIDKAPIDETKRGQLTANNEAAAQKALNDLNAEAAQKRRNELEQILKARNDIRRNPLPVQAALERGTAGALSVGIKAQAARSNQPDAQTAANTKAMLEEIKRLNQYISKLTGKPIELVKGSF